MTDIAISVSGVNKCYRVFQNQRSRLVHAIYPGCAGGVEEIWALKDISFEIKHGEAVAIIGRNGGGKSTLLEILTGTLAPTTGIVKVNGRVSALLELGSGFNPEYSGRDNVILNGLLLGLSKSEIVNRFSEIEAFAEIGDAIERPVKTYSSGMMMRLAFAVQVLCDPDILIIDEALSVGDFFFQQKCFSYIRRLHSKGVTLLFVSHDMGAVRDLCMRAIYLQCGTLKMMGEVNATVQRYLSDDSSLGDSSMPSTIYENPPSQKRFREGVPWAGNALWEHRLMHKATQVLAVGVQGAMGNQTLSTQMGESLSFVVWYQAEETAPVHINLALKNRYGQLVNCTSSYTLGMEMPSNLGRNIAMLSFDMKMQLEAGQYSFQISISMIDENPNQGHILDETPWIGPLILNWDYAFKSPFYGMFGLQVQVSPPTIYAIERTGCIP